MKPCLFLALSSTPFLLFSFFLPVALSFLFTLSFFTACHSQSVSIALTYLSAFLGIEGNCAGLMSIIVNKHSNRYQYVTPGSQLEQTQGKSLDMHTFVCSSNVCLYSHVCLTLLALIVFSRQSCFFTLRVKSISLTFKHSKPCGEKS